MPSISTATIAATTATPTVEDFDTDAAHTARVTTRTIEFTVINAIWNPLPGDEGEIPPVIDREILLLPSSSRFALERIDVTPHG